MKTISPKVVEQPNLLDKIKKLVVIAMFSDDYLLEILVLKGGNALDIVHKLSARASVDIDFSIQQDFGEDIESIRKRVERTLIKTFKTEGFQVFDVNVKEKPHKLSPDMEEFWGGYGFEFKIINLEDYLRFSSNIEQLRRNAINIGQGSKFLIDISKFEYITGKEIKYLDEYQIFVYTPAMIVCEKLRAICQQMEDYSSIVKREKRGGNPRARDFIDIYTLIEKLNLNIYTDLNITTLTAMFAAKKVPLNFLGNIEKYREFHRISFPAVLDTMKAGVPIKTFDEYFDFVLQIVEQLKPFWNK